MKPKMLWAGHLSTGPTETIQLGSVGNPKHMGELTETA